jgi:hypothetical protein
MANTTFSGAVRSETGFKVINKASGTGAITETGVNINSTGQLVALGTHKFQSFAGTLASTDAADTAYGDGDVLVELGTLNTDHPDDLVTATKFFIHRALIGITTAAGEVLVGGLSLSATSGTATNSAVSSGTEIVGAGVTSFNEQLSATQSVTEIDVNLNNTAGNYHIFVPNVTAAIASKYLYAFTTTAINADITAGRFTVELEYSVY